MCVRRIIRALVQPRVKMGLLTSRATALTDIMGIVVTVKRFGFYAQDSHSTLEKNQCLSKWSSLRLKILIQKNLDVTLKIMKNSWKFAGEILEKSYVSPEKV